MEEKSVSSGICLYSGFGSTPTTPTRVDVLRLNEEPWAALGGLRRGERGCDWGPAVPPGMLGITAAFRVMTGCQPYLYYITLGGEGETWNIIDFWGPFPNFNCCG